jgi:4-hydroxybenzoate polyprenyltransferase
MFPCWWGVLAYSDTVPYLTLALFAAGAVVMRSAGCIVNDMADRKIDAQVTRTRSRPLASGEVSMKAAYALLGGLLLIALIIALLLGWKVAALGALWLPLVAAYPFMKRYTWWPQAFLGITFGAGPLFGMVAVTGGTHATGLLLYAASMCWVIGYDTIYACQDRIDDARIGVKSTARLFGARVQAWVGGFYGLSAVFFIAALCLTPDSNFFFLIPALTLLLWQVIRLRPEDPARCARLFHLNVWVGALVTVACMQGKI